MVESLDTVQAVLTNSQNIGVLSFLCYQHFLVKNAKHGTTWAAMKKDNSSQLDQNSRYGGNTKKSPETSLGEANVWGTSSLVGRVREGKPFPGMSGLRHHFRL